MPLTPTYGLPYPAVSDPPNGPTQLQALAAAAEAAMVGLDSRISQIEGPAVCRVQFPGAGYPQDANTRIMASSGWTAIEDDLSMFSIVGSLAQVKIPTGFGGRYYVSFKASATGASGSRGTFVLLNSTDPNSTTASLVSDIRPVAADIADTAWPHAQRRYPLAAGDILRWGFVVGASGGTIQAAVARNGEPSEMYIERVALS